ncbi:zinc finger protein 585B-like [Maniola hyperantus]|uniref:zinc finger protein 585B-like n=1 Tax=Aphantopus hyperantus TaxID=2795564 RepID=UPI003749BB07
MHINHGEPNNPGPSKTNEELNPKRTKTTDKSEMDQHKNNITVVIQNTNATPFQRHGEIGYTCYFCKNDYLNPKDLKKHTIETHNDDDIEEICKGKPLRYYLVKLDITDLACRICDEEIYTLKELFDHLESHGKIIYRDINNRIIPFRFDNEKHKCTICSVEFSKFKRLHDHLNTHFRNYICKFCSTGFITLGMLSSHEASHKIGVYECGYCDKKFNTDKNKKVHETVMHADVPKDAKRKSKKQEKDECTANDTKGESKKQTIGEESDESTEIDTDPIKSAESGQKGVREKHRENIFVVVANTNATPFGKCNDTGYGCQFCAQKYFNPKDLKEHTLKTHASKDSLSICKRVDSYIVKLDITNLVCKICNNSIEVWDKLFNHLESHGKAIHRDVNNHIIPFQFDGDRLVCAVCPRVFNKFKLLRQHMNVHFSNYTCDVCYVGFITERMRTAHMQCHKTGVFKCSFCEKSFTTHRNKKAHENMVHVNLNYASTCGFCKEKFKTYKQKHDHLSAAHGITRKQVSCSACNRSFESQAKLTNHVKRDHLLERLYKCDECDQAFFSKVDLGRHFVKHSGLKQFECNLCMKAFFYRKSLREHMRIHTNDKRFKCDRCGKAFIQKWNWLGHMRRKHCVEITDKVVSIIGQ